MGKKRFFISVACLIVVAVVADCSKKVIKTPDVMNEKKVSAVEDQSPEKSAVNPSRGDDGGIQDLLVPIYFEFDRYNLSQSEIGKLERIAPLLREKTNIRIVCEGHCDERGSSEYNMGLGENRAYAVKKWLTAYGIPDARVETNSYGDQKPVETNCSDEFCHSKNRRVEWKIMSY